MAFIDAHCHLEHENFNADVMQVIQRADESQTQCISHGTGKENNEKTLRLADGKTVFPAVGQDPFHAKENLEIHLAFLEKNAGKLAAVGEIGLDQHYFTKEELPLQKEVFEAQLRFAESKGLACVIHTRKAVEMVLETLPSYRGKHVLHFFLEKKHAQKALDRECFLSLPTVKSKDRIAIIRKAPLDRLLCETDAPYGWRGRNEPKNVREAYQTIADELKKPLDEVATQINTTAKSVFRL